MGELLTTHIPTTLNPADLATKLIPGGIKRDSLLNLIMYNIAVLSIGSAPKIQRVPRVSPYLLWDAKYSWARSQNVGKIDQEKCLKSYIEGTDLSAMLAI